MCLCAWNLSKKEFLQAWDLPPSELEDVSDVPVRLEFE